MKVLKIIIVSVALLGLISCSTPNRDSGLIDYRAAAKPVPALDIPPDLTTPVTDEHFKVPRGDSETIATYSDYSKGDVSQGKGTSTVLPEIPGVSMERYGKQRWLVVSESPDTVWAVVRAFFQETGLVIKTEDLAAGVMETDWAENRAKIPMGAIRSVLGKVFDKVYASGERDQYIVRLERSKDAQSTEIHITHRGLIEVYASDQITSKWQPRANDPELEAIMLQRLMVRFGATEQQAASSVVATSPSAGTSDAAIITTEPAGTASLREVSDGSVVMIINDPFDRAWRKVGLAIESSNLQVEDRDRSKGIYYLLPVKVETGWWESLKFWKANEAAKTHYQVLVKEGGTACEVSVSAQNGIKNKVTKQLIEAIYKNINQ